jgi:hypothetical protein
MPKSLESSSNIVSTSPNDQAPLPGEMVHMLDRRDGNVLFNYPLQTGQQAFIISHVRELVMDAAARGTAKDRKRALDRAAQFIARHDDISREIARQWSAYVETLVARYERSAPVASPREECFA